MLKVSITDTNFVTNNKDVLCTICTSLKCDGKLVTLKDTPRIRVFKGEAHYDSSDTFNYKKGKAIALAKAERAAYKYWANAVYSTLADLGLIIKSAPEFVEKCYNVIDHNSEYIKELTK